MPKKPSLLAVTLLVLLGTILPYSTPPRTMAATTAASTAPGSAPVNQPDSRTFPETGHTVKGKFLKYWQEHGGLPQQGYPISEEMQEKSDIDGKTYTVQYFERAVFEDHPENQPPNDILLSLLGVLQYRQKYPNETPSQLPNTSPGSVLFPETGKRAGGKFLQYWQTHGGLAQQGYPITDEFTEVSSLDGKTYTVQYFERAVFELHPENVGTEYEVLLSQLGKFQYDARYGANATPTATIPAPTSSATATPAPTSVPVPVEITNWIREHAVPFTTEQPGTDYSDLMTLKQIIGDARVVALGEATHGTHEFFAMKHRVLEFLVKEMGFSVFGIEDTWAGSESINDYVQGGPGDPNTIVKKMNFWTWQTTEVRDMITWMRQHNQNPGSAPRVSFHGFDMQDVTLAVDHVVAYVRKVDPSEAQRVQELYSCIASLGLFPSRYTELPQEAKAECRAKLEAVYDHLESHQEDYEQLSTQREFANALHGAHIVLQVEECYAPPYCLVRDRYMAENSAWLLEQGGPGAKIVLWAHNGHVASFTDITPEYNWGSMGHYLRERFGEEAVIFGFDFHSGSFNAVTMRDNQFMGLNVHRVEPPPADSYEHYFAGAGIARMFLDLRGVDTNLPETSWLEGPRRMRFIGSVYDRSTPERWFMNVKLPEWFDVLIYFQDTTASGLLR